MVVIWNTYELPDARDHRSKQLDTNNTEQANINFLKKLNA